MEWFILLCLFVPLFGFAPLVGPFAGAAWLMVKAARHASRRRKSRVTYENRPDRKQEQGGRVS